MRRDVEQQHPLELRFNFGLFELISFLMLNAISVFFISRCWQIQLVGDLTKEDFLAVFATSFAWALFSVTLGLFMSERLRWRTPVDRVLLVFALHVAVALSFCLVFGSLGNKVSEIR